MYIKRKRIGENSVEAFSLYKGMPEYTASDKSPIKQLLVSFDSVEAFLEFKELVGQDITMKTKSIFFPPRPLNSPSLMSFMDESDAE